MKRARRRVAEDEEEPAESAPSWEEDGSGGEDEADESGDDAGSASASSPGGSQSGSDEEDEALANLEAELAEVPFELLQEMQKDGRRGFTHPASKTLGSGAAAKRSGADSKPADGGEAGGGEGRKSGKPKRENKNRPLEMSSKRPVSRYMEVVQQPKKERRDPRFDATLGRFDETAFKRSYAFLEEMQAQELQELRKKAAKEKNPEKRKQLLEQAKREEQRRQEKRRQEEKQQRRREHKKATLAKVRTGAKPFYLKKSAERKLELLDRYRELESKGQLERFMAKKRKKRASKDHRLVPHARRDAAE